MVQGIRISLPTTLTNNTLPIVTTDSIITNGSLILVEPGNINYGWSNGVPSVGYIKNLADKQAKVILGSGVETRPTFAVGTGWDTDSSKRLFERSEKGGLHVLTARAGDTAPGSSKESRFAGIMFPEAVLSHIHKTPTHSFYFSLWHRITRPSGITQPSNPIMSFIGPLSTVTSNHYMYLRSDLSRPLPNAIGSSGTDIVGPSFRSVAFYTATGTIPPGTTSGSIVRWGHIPTSTLGYLSSWIFYRAYLEDLTISGRTYSEVSMFDQSLYQQEVIQPGGRYYSDTFTNPESLP